MNIYKSKTVELNLDNFQMFRHWYRRGKKITLCGMPLREFICLHESCSRCQSFPRCPKCLSHAGEEQ